jgi:ATP synthase protein I
MTEYDIMFKRNVSLNLFALSFFATGWALTSYDTVFLGLLLGGAGSLYNLWTVHSKTNKLGNAVVNSERPPKSLGSLSRLMIAGLAVLIAMRYPEHFHLVSVVVGLMISYIIIFIDFSFQKLRRKRGE